MLVILEGWDGQATTDYFIYATPTMFLVDKEKKLIGMPKTIEEIKSFTSKLIQAPEFNPTLPSSPTCHLCNKGVHPSIFLYTLSCL